MEILLYDWDENGVFLIVEDTNSPVIYCNQTGGYKCRPSKQKGVIFPVEFEAGIHVKFNNDSYKGSGWELDSKEFYNDLPIIIQQLNNYFDGQYIFEFNDKECNEEAWVHFKGTRTNLVNDGDMILGIPERFNAILTWQNSD